MDEPEQSHSASEVVGGILKGQRQASMDDARVESKTTEPQTPQFPDGGLVAWMQVAMGFLINFSSWGLITSFGVFQTYYKEAPALAATSSISWIGSTQSFLLLFCGAFCGRLMDAGYARPMVITGTLLIVLGMVCTSMSGNLATAGDDKPELVYWQVLLSQGICEGVGMGFTFLPSVGIPATYFVRRRALATGIATTGASLGGIIYPIMFEQLLASVGFRWAVRAQALLALITLATACLLIRQRTDMPRKAKGPLVEFKALLEPLYLTIVLSMASSFAGVYAVYYFLQSRIVAAGVNLHGLKSYYLISLLNVGGLFGRLAPNYLADKVNPLVIHSYIVFIGGILIFAWPFVLSLAGLVIFALLYGFFSGGFTSMPPASVASVTPDMTRFGARLGLAVSVNGFAVLAGTPIAGAIIGNGLGYVRASIFAGVVVLAGGIGLGLAALQKTGRW